MKQEHFSPRQHQWIDVLSEFNFNIQYIPGKDNKFANLLSRIYSNEPNGVVHAESELVNKGDDMLSNIMLRMKPVYIEVYLLDLMSTEMARRLSRFTDKPSPHYKKMKDWVLRLRNRDPKNLVAVESGSVGPHHLEEAQHPPAQEEGKEQEGPLRAGNRLFEVSSNLGVSFPRCIENQYDEDKFFAPILTNPDEFTNFIVRDGLVFFVSEGMERVVVSDVQVNNQKVREILISQAHSILAHLGDEKTVTYLRDQVWWKTMVDDVSAYCKTCQRCVVSKPQQGKVHGRLKTMLVPTYPWQYIRINFVGPLPESANRTGGYNMICVIIDLLT